MHFSFLNLRSRDADRVRPFKVPGGAMLAYLVSGLCLFILALSILLFFWVPGAPVDVTYIMQVGVGLLITLTIGEVLVRQNVNNSQQHKMGATKSI